ncbi:glycosyltransferase [Pannus brasiliensis CCIBt3594]|uniref:Glycosyltransferase n=1 Tax=Pannus brasiliensis CCIBt3594 TaxID=1427578 RepID=A0AAW9R097_9CHRO
MHELVKENQLFSVKNKKIVYLAQNSVDTFNHNDLYFSAMADACASHDITLHPVDIGSDRWQEDLLTQARDERVLFFFGLNGFGNDLSIHRDRQPPVSLFEFADKPYLTSFSDPPFISEMWEHTRSNFRGKIYIYTDHSYLNLATLFQSRDEFQDNYFYSGFCPQSSTDDKRDRNRENPAEKSIDILFAATLVDPDIYYQNFLKLCQKELILAKGIFEDIVDSFLLNLRSDCVDWIRHGFIKNGLLFDLQIDWHRILIECVSGYIKFKRRQIILENLKEVPLTIMSLDVPYKLPTHPDTKILPPVPFQEFQNILANTRVCLCPTPHYRGFHERVISAMYENCLVLTTPNQVLEEEFIHNQSILFFQDLDKDLVHKIDYCQNNPEKVRQICLNARSIALEKFTARKALDKFLTIYQNYRYRQEALQGSYLSLNKWYGVKEIGYGPAKTSG